MSVITLIEAEAFSRDQKKMNKSVVFTNGCFDLIHAGHLELLQKAKAEGDILMVGLNSDSSVKKLKGDSRPIQSENDRAAILDSMKPVDCVVIFHEETPLELIKQIHPHVLVKGEDYPLEYIVGAEEVSANGGNVGRIPLVADCSTQAIIQKIKNW